MATYRYSVWSCPLAKYPLAARVLAPMWRAGRLIGINHFHTNKWISTLCSLYCMALTILMVGVFLPCCIYDLSNEEWRLSWLLVNKGIALLFLCVTTESTLGVWCVQLSIADYLGALDRILAAGDFDVHRLEKGVKKSVAAVVSAILLTVGAQVAIQLLIPHIIYMPQPLRSLGCAGGAALAADTLMLLFWGVHGYAVVLRMLFDIGLMCRVVRETVEGTARRVAAAAAADRCADKALWPAATARIESALAGMSAVNGIYGWSMLLVASTSLCWLLLTVYFMLLSATTAGERYESAGSAAIALSMQASWLALALVILGFMFEPADAVVRAGRSAVRTLHKAAAASAPPLDAESKERIEWLVGSIASGELALSAAGFFSFDRTGVVTSVSTVVTYLIVLLQTRSGGISPPAGRNHTAQSA